LSTLAEPYLPREDSFLIRRIVEQIKAECALEIGCGVGFVLEELAQRCGWVVGVDLDLNSLRQAKIRLEDEGFVNFDLVCSSSAKAFRAKSFDLVVFNPPYLPSERVEDRAVDGGRGGVEVTLDWLRECARVVKSGGKVVIISSSLASQEALTKEAKTLGFRIRLLATHHLFFEDLYAYELSLS